VGRTAKKDGLSKTAGRRFYGQMLANMRPDGSLGGVQRAGCDYQFAAALVTGIQAT